MINVEIVSDKKITNFTLIRVYKYCEWNKAGFFLPAVHQPFFFFFFFFFISVPPVGPRHRALASYASTCEPKRGRKRSASFKTPFYPYIPRLAP